jgi:hypothetical protein
LYMWFSLSVLKKIIMCIRSLFFSSFYVKKENREREMGEVRKQA